MWYFLIGIIMGALFVYYWNYTKKLQNVEILKNALLSFALSRVNQKDFDHWNMNYATFDGTKLPMMSGYDLPNALCSYIVDKADLRKGPFYTKSMEDKNTAIDKYLAKNFDSHEKVQEFLNNFVSQLPKTPIVKDEDEGQNHDA